MKFTVIEPGAIDLESGPSGLLKEESLNTAVIVSLLTDRRAEPDDRLPTDDGTTSVIGADRRGWCGDSLAEQPGQRIGSRLWLLAREKQTEETRRRAVSYCQEALEWLVDDGVASAVSVEAAWADIGRLNAQIEIALINGDRFSARLSDITGEITYAV